MSETNRAGCSPGTGKEEPSAKKSAASASDADATRVWVKSNRGGSSASVYHTDSDCQSVERAATIFETTLSELLERRPGLTECKRCSGDMEKDAPSRSIYEAALAYDPDAEDERELVTDGGEDPTGTPSTGVISSENVEAARERQLGGGEASDSPRPASGSLPTATHPDPQTIRGVASVLDEAATAIEALHLGDVSEERAHKLRQLQEEIRVHRDGLEEVAAESEGSR